MAESDTQEPKTYTQEEVETLIAEKLAGVKAEDDPAFKNLWKESKEAKARARELEGKLKEIEHQTKAQQAGVTSTELERLRAEIRADLEKSVAERYSDYDSLRTENRALKLDNVVKAEMGKAGVRPERLDALYRLAADQFDLTEDGKPMVKSRMGTPVEKYVAEELKKEYPEFYLGTGSSGGGASKSSGGATGGVRRILASDSKAIAANAEDIIAGKVEVVMG